MRRFEPGRYAIFNLRNGVKYFFTGKFDGNDKLVMAKKQRTVPRESSDTARAKVFLSARHAYCFGAEHRGLQSWRVGRV